MKILFNKKFLLHNEKSNYEGPYRLEKFKDIEDTFQLGDKWINLVHSKEYHYAIKQACLSNQIIAEVQLNRMSYDCALLAVGLSVIASKNGDFAVVRPPGHHAGNESTLGFCLFNNIAIATQKLVNEGKRVLLLDIDGHHGNGTQEIFYQNNKVLFCSIHQEGVYPFSGLLIEKGKGAGFGYNINYPLEAGSGDTEFLDKISKIIKIAKEFKPDVIAVSAGFDGYEKDKLLELKYSQYAYYECAFRLKKAFKNQIVFAVLEGGYHNNTRKLVDSFIEGIHNGGKPPKMKYDEDMAIG